jgi:hypothetical protein
VTFVAGGKEQNTELLKLPDDFIFFTGSTFVGKIGARAAAEAIAPQTIFFAASGMLAVWSTTAGYPITWDDKIMAQDRLVNPVAPKLEEFLPEMANWRPNAVICATGTTSKKAGSKEAFRSVDRALLEVLIRAGSQSRASSGLDFDQTPARTACTDVLDRISRRSGLFRSAMPS